MPNAAILLSRQPKYPHGGLLWVRNTIEAVKFARQKGYTILTSVGMNTWELTLAASRICGAQVKVILEDSYDRDRESERGIRFQFDLRDLDEITGHQEKESKGKDSHRERDAAIIEQADILFPVSIRGNGLMAGLIDQAEKRGKTIDRSFQVPYAARAVPLAYSVPVNSLSDEAKRLGDDYLTHWTRSSSGPWPDERAIDYYTAIINSDTYPRGAFDTLCHLMESRRLIASKRHMPRNVSTVAFTALPIREVLSLMRWRAKYAEMAFEPYGVGIRRDLAGSLGVYPVQYYDQNGAFPECSVEPWLTQSIGVKTDWRHEREYRYKGDLSLKPLSTDGLIAFCPTQKETVALFSATGIRTLALFE